MSIICLNYLFLHFVLDKSAVKRLKSKNVDAMKERIIFFVDFKSGCRQRYKLVILVTGVA